MPDTIECFYELRRNLSGPEFFTTGVQSLPSDPEFLNGKQPPCLFHGNRPYLSAVQSTGEAVQMQKTAA